MNPIKKLAFAAVVAVVGLCGTAWAVMEQVDDYMFDKETGTITGYTGAGGHLEIPAQLGGVDVTSIHGGAFMSKETLNSVTIPAGVTNVGQYAFQQCHNLTSETFAEGSQLKNIEKYAFEQCEKLASVTFPAGCPLENIGKSVFDASGMTSITIPAGVTNIGEQAFVLCSSLASVTFAPGSQLKEISSMMFGACAALTQVTIPASVTRIGQGAFGSCPLTGITLPA